MDCSSGRLYGAASSGYDSECCPPVVDPYSLLALLAGIALATYFLRLALVAALKRKKRDVGSNDLTSDVSTGKECGISAIVIYPCRAGHFSRNFAPLKVD